MTEKRRISQLSIRPPRHDLILKNGGIISSLIGFFLDPRGTAFEQ